MPPEAGTGNSCDWSRSPCTVVAAVTLVPGVKPANSARPVASVFTVRGAPAPVQLDLLIGNVVGERAPDDADDHGSGRNVGHRQGNARDRFRIGHLLRLRALARRQDRDAQEHGQRGHRAT